MPVHVTADLGRQRSFDDGLFRTPEHHRIVQAGGDPPQDEHQLVCARQRPAVR